MAMLVRPPVAGMLLLLCLLAFATPAHAAIGLFDPRTPAFAVLDAGELDRIKGLASVAPVGFASPLSPDEGSVVATLGNRLVFLDPRTGSVQPIDTQRVNAVRRLTNLAWTGPNSVVYLGVDTAQRVPVQVTFNRANGSASVTPVQLPGPPLEGLPSLSPDGRHVLVAVLRQAATSTAHFDELTSPFTLQARLGLGMPRGFDEEEPTLRAAAEPVTLLIVEVASGQATPISTYAPGSGIQALAWSGNGQQLAISRYAVPEDQLVSPLRSVVNLETQGSLPPERNPFLQSNVVDLYTVGGEMRPGVLRAAEVNALYSLLAWSPDGGVMMARLDHPTRLAGRAHPTYLIPERSSYRATATDGRLLGEVANASLEAPVGSLTVLNAEEAIVNTAVGSDGAVLRINRASGQVTQVPLPAGLSTGLRILTSTQQMAMLHTSFTRMPELYRVNLDGSALTALTAVNAERAALNQVRADGVSFTLANGQTRAGYLIQPAAAAFPPQNVPVVVWQEGGPMSTVLNTYAANVENPYNLLPNFGVAVLFLPLEGRIGYGIERFRALYDGDNFGKIDIDAQAEVVQQMITRGWTATGKVGITGCSYGGYFAFQSIARHPNLYAAANPQCSLLDLTNEWQFGDRSPLISFVMGGAPTTRIEAFDRASPVFGLGQTRSSTLIFHGTQDFLPIAIAATAHDQLQGNGVAVNMLAFAGEGHGLAQPNSELMASQWQVQWFRQYLK